MFGYIRFSKGELKIKDYETYRAVYCSLCKQLGKSYGILSRFTLSYDFTFLAVMNLALTDECQGFKAGRCAFNPLKKCAYCKDGSALLMPSAAAMIMLYYKLCDNIADSKALKKLGYKMIKPLFKRAHKKAAADFPQIEQIVSGFVKEQNRLEGENEKSIDMAADPTAKALSGILPLCTNDENQKRVLSRIGYCLGRYIYLLDAACDFCDDLKSGNYNVLKHYAKTAEEAKERVKPQLYACQNEAKLAFELLEFRRYKPILGNIIYLGLEDTFLKEFKEIANEQSV